MRKIPARSICQFVLLILLLMCIAGPALGQSLEPRRWSHLPVGLNVLGTGLATSSGIILFDPVLRIEDASFDLNALAVSYVRAFDLFGKSSRFDVVVPLVDGTWDGLLDGVQTSVDRQGLSDPWFRFSVNLYGAPALKGKEYMQYRAQHQTNTTIGAGLTIIAPVGEYSAERLINLGNNRWSIRPQVGVLHQREKLELELTTSVFFHQDNNDFYLGTKLTTTPLWFTQGHVIYTFNPRWWTSASLGYAYGAESTINGVKKNDSARTSFMAAAVGFNISRTQGLKLTYVRTRTNTSRGKDSDTFSLGWSFRWAK